MKCFIIALWIAVGLHASNAQAASWQPAPGHTQVPIWPGVAPGARAGADSETTGTVPHRVAGTWDYVSKVSRPTLTVYSPKGKNTGAALLVFPGGGYQSLAIDIEGTEIC